MNIELGKNEGNKNLTGKVQYVRRDIFCRNCPCIDTESKLDD